MGILTVAQWRLVAGLLLILAVILGALCVSQFHKARRAPYYILRHIALRRGTRYMLAVVVLLVTGIVLMVAAPYLATLITLPAPLPTVAPTRTPTVTPHPTHTPSATPARRPTATPPPIPTPTPAMLPPDMALTPLPSAVPAGESARIALVALALERDASGRPVNPGNEFPSGDYRVYLFFSWENMQNNITTTFAWYKDGELIDFCSDTWLWGAVEGRDWGERGWTSYYCRLPGGWRPGRYEIRVFIESRLQGIAQFVVVERPTEEPTPVPTETAAMPGVTRA